ncbi:MAG: hypothetical protein AB7G93_06165 [Bdellovibrionales bacterium]
MNRYRLLLIYIAVAISTSIAHSGENVRPQALPEEWDHYGKIVFRSEPLTNLKQMDPGVHLFGRSSFRPWNSSYWPTQKGMIAHRYADPQSPKSTKWFTNFDYYVSQPPASYVAAGRIADLSPAEKYDLLVDDPEWTLTQRMWQKGEPAAKKYGNVPKWWGLCHGWAAVIHTGIPDPGHAIQVMSANGQHIVTFYPEDIRALLTYLWGTSAPRASRAGERCTQGQPRMDENGRVIEPYCFDNNPKTWHLTVVNRVGRDGDSLVMDSAVGSEVWNYAIDSYVLRYFDVRTLKPARYWEQVKVDRSQFAFDPYKTFRAEKTKYIVGVDMEVFYPTATVPRARKATRTMYGSKRFTYDLELDENMNVIGGEWYSTERPDFVWTFPFEARPSIPEDAHMTGEWGIFAQLPPQWAEQARVASRQGRISAKIVDALHERSLLGDLKPNEPAPEQPTPEPEPEVPELAAAPNEAETHSAPVPSSP